MKNKFNSKIILVFIVLILFIGSTYFFIKINSSSNIKELNEITDNKINKPTELVKKEEGKLILKLDNGKEKVILDIIGEGDVFPETDTSENQSEDTRIYTFDKLFNDINCYGIIVEYYVGMDHSHYFLLVNKKNGEEISLISKNIIISPNKQRIVSYNYDLISGFTPNGFDVVSFNGDNFNLEYRSEFIDWGPSKARWINDSELEFEKIVINNNYDEEIAGVVNFKLLDNKWIEVK